MIVVVMPRVFLDYYGASNMRNAAIVAILVILSALPATADDEIPSNKGSSTVGSGSTANPDDDGWSKPIRGVEARISLVERPKVNGTRSIVPYLELRNVSDVANPIHVACGRDHVKFELTDSEGKVVREGWTLGRSGPHADPGTITLPFDSSIRIGMHCTNWGVPKDAAGMIATDSGAWILQPEEKGSVFLRVTINNVAEGKSRQNWRGSLISPLKKVDWKE